MDLDPLRKKKPEKRDVLYEPNEHSTRMTRCLTDKKNNVLEQVQNFHIFKILAKLTGSIFTLKILVMTEGHLILNHFN